MVQSKKVHASYGQKILLAVILLSLLFLAVAAEEPGQADCCEVDACLIRFDPVRVENPPMQFGDHKIIKLELRCDDKRTDAEFRIATAGRLVNLASTVIANNLGLCEGKNPPCMNLWIRNLENLTEYDRNVVIRTFLVTTGAPITWSSAVALALLIEDRSQNAWETAAAVGVAGAVVTVEATYQDEEGKTKKVRASISVKIDPTPVLQEFLQSNAEASPRPLQSSFLLE